MPSKPKDVSFNDVSLWAAQLFEQQLAAHHGSKELWLSHAIVCASAFIKLKREHLVAFQVAERNLNDPGPTQNFPFSILKMPYDTIIRQCVRFGWALDEWFEFAVLCVELVEQRRRK